ncbi:MAG: nickel-responsive transcriptional regulator NikR [Alphaproteobacteria bacterium]|nr:nickel-responsive transcriptional regulator NikR [Alphaproteobacteria bacterium]
MQRITISINDELLAALDRVIEKRGYQNRSEAIRDLTRAGMIAHEEESEPSEGIAALVYAYDHEARELAKRLTRSFHDHHDLSLATMHVHLDHDSCLEVAVLRGAMGEIRHFAEHVMAERGVRYGRLVTVPVATEAANHAHGYEPSRPHLHTHVREIGD